MQRLGAVWGMQRNPGDIEFDTLLVFCHWQRKLIQSSLSILVDVIPTMTNVQMTYSQTTEVFYTVT